MNQVANFAAVAFVCLVFLLSIVIWSIRRHRDPKLHIECSSPIDELIPSLAGLTLSTAVAGNSVEVLENGAFFDVLLQRIRSAQKSVHFETFLWKEGVLGQRLLWCSFSCIESSYSPYIPAPTMTSSPVGIFARLI